MPTGDTGFRNRRMLTTTATAPLAFPSTCRVSGLVHFVTKKLVRFTENANKVSGLMLANHTSIRHLFTKCVTQYDKLMRRKAFLDQYEQHPMFADGLEEFDDAREIVEGLAEEYEACESPDYIKWASGKENERSTRVERMPGEGAVGGLGGGY